MENKKSLDMPYSKLAIIALVLSLPFILLIGTDPRFTEGAPFAIILLASLAAIILGIISLFHIKRHQLKGRWLAILAIILGFSPLILLLMLIVGVILFGF